MAEHNQKRILMVSASPAGMVRVRVDQEHRTVKEVLLESSGRDGFDINLLSAAQGTEFQREIIAYKPHIVHFSGHAEKDGIALDGGEKTQWISNDAIISLLESAAGHVECVVFNACWTESLAESVGQSIDYVVGMKTAVFDDVAIEFSRGFYMALFSGKFYPDAFGQGRIAVQMKGLKEHDVPQLKIREKALRAAFVPGADPDILILCHESQTVWADDIRRQLDDLMAQEFGRNSYTLELAPDNSARPPELAETAGLIMPVFSESFSHSDICGRSIGTFLKTEQDADRVFLLEFDSTPRPSKLQQVLTYRFWKSGGTLIPQTDSSFHSRLDLLKNELADRLRRLKSEVEHQQRIKAQLNRPRDGKVDLPGALLFINASPEDHTLLNDVIGFLNDNSAEYIQPAAVSGNLDPDEIRRDLENNLYTCDLYMVIYGCASVMWVREQINFSRRVWRRRKQDVKIVVVHNKTGNGPKDPINIKLNNLRVCDCPPGDIAEYLPKIMKEAVND